MRRLFAVEGLACPSCAQGLERRLSKVSGVSFARVHYLTGSALLDWDESLTDKAALSESVRISGYRLLDRHRLEELVAVLDNQVRTLAIRLAVAVLFGMWSMAFAVVIYVGNVPPESEWWFAAGSGLFAVPVVFWSGHGILSMAWRSLRLRTPGMDLLIAIGALSALAISAWSLGNGSAVVWFDTAAMLVTLLLLARMIDAQVRRNAVRSLDAVERTAPRMVSVQRGDSSISLPVAEVGIGETVVIDAGSAVSIDGIVHGRSGVVSRASLTGEASPVEVQPGDRLQAGSINLSNRLTILVDRHPGDRDLDRMGGHAAIEAARAGAPIETSESWAAHLAIGIPVLTILVLTASLTAGLTVETSLVRALSLLVATCPCALAIAVPMARLRAYQVGSMAGFKIRNPAAFERLVQVRHAVFDKTGTLTRGLPEVVRVEPEVGVPEDELLDVAARAETGIAHPIARAVIRRAGFERGDGGTAHPREASFIDTDGEIITVSGNGTTTDGLTRIAVKRGQTLIGHLIIADEPEERAGGTIDRLSRAGLSSHIATGDSAAAGHAIACAVGIAPTNVYAALTPAAKAELLRRLDGPAVFIGDGVNDAPALAAAACGISIASAHPSARETADVVIDTGGVERIPLILHLARRTVAIGRQNIALAIIYNAAVPPLAALGWLTPEFAAVAMAASSLSVLANAMRLR